MEEAGKIDWEPILWVAGGIGTFFLLIISSLLGWIGVMHRETKEAIIKKNVEQDDRLEKHEGWILKQQEELGELGKTTYTAIELIKQEQKQGQERLKIFQENFFRKGKK